MRWFGTLLVPALLAACDAMPRDIAGASDRIARTRVIRVGLPEAPDADARRFLADLSARTGAKIQTVSGSLEPLLEALDHDRIDLVVAPVRAEGVLADAVALTTPLDGSDVGDRPVQWRAAVRNGENRWIVTVERAARAAAAR